MNFQPEALLQAVRTLGAEAAAFLPVGEIPFDLSFREMCRSNACGMYGQCWMCPPDVGEAPDLIARGPVLRSGSRLPDHLFSGGQF